MSTKTAKKNKIPNASAITSDPVVVWLSSSLIFSSFERKEVVGTMRNETRKDVKKTINAIFTGNIAQLVRHMTICLSYWVQ